MATASLTPPFLASTSPDVDNVEAAVDKRIEEILAVILDGIVETPTSETPSSQVM